MSEFSSCFRTSKIDNMALQNVDEIRKSMLKALGETMVEILQTLEADGPGCHDLISIRLQKVWRLLHFGQRMGVDKSLSDGIANILQVIVQEQNAETEPGIAGVSLVQEGTVGRPYFDIPESTLEFYLENNFSIPDIAAILHVSIRTIERRMSFYGLTVQDTYSNLDDDSLDHVMTQVKAEFPNAGIRILKGLLKAKGHRVQYERIIQCLHRVDTVGVFERRFGFRPIHRVAYCVKTPLALWHIDSNLKMRRYKIVFHGGVDGYSRLITYLHASTDNTSATVLKYFVSATEQYYVPSRVRSDRGMENIDVARFMLDKRGVGRGSIITGPSVHNQRIERTWRDVNENFSRFYLDLFAEMERTKLLDINDDLCIYSLHLVFMPVIEAKLQLFVQGWNSHPLRTMRNKSPLQLFHGGLAKISLNDFQDLERLTDLNEEDYGVDWHGPVPREDNTTDEDFVALPRMQCPLDGEHLFQLVGLLRDSDEDVVSKYRLALDYITRALPH